MSSPPILQDQTLAGMLTAVAGEAEARRLDLSAAVRRAGWESVVLETSDWIVRFPRDPDVARFETELAVLQHVRGRLPVATPAVAWTGRRTRCMAYPKLTGTAFVAHQWHAASAGDRQRLTGSLAELLDAWRAAFHPVDAVGPGLTPMEQPPYLRQLTESADGFPPSLRPLINGFLTTYRRTFDDSVDRSGRVVLHGDFHLGNMVLDRPCGAVRGLWDFSCVAIGGFAWDLHYLAGEIDDPAVDPSPPGSGRHLDLVRDVIRQLPGLDEDPASTLLLCDLMHAAEWIGDHDQQEAEHRRGWLQRLAVVAGT